MSHRMLFERPSSSAMKIFYLIVFGFSAFSIVKSFNSSFSRFEEEIGRSFVQIPKSEIAILGSVALGLAVFTILHLCRIYVTLELLEEPHSELHSRMVAPLNNFFRVIEQILRLGVIGIVSSKLVIIDHNEGHWFKGIGNYLFLLYLSLIFWDVVVLIGRWANQGFPAKPSLFFKDIWSESYFTTSLLGMAIAFSLINLDSVKSYTAHVLITGALTVLFGGVLLWDILVVNLAQYMRHFKNFCMDMIRPYYGEKCELEACKIPQSSGSVTKAQSVNLKKI